MGVASTVPARMTGGSSRAGRRVSWTRGWVFRLAVGAAGLAAGCGGDDILDRADEIRRDRAAGGEAAPAAPPADGPEAGGPPAVPERPGPVAEPAPGTPEEPRPVDPQGPTRELRGTVEAPGWKGGAIRVDVFDGDQQAAASTGQRPRVVAMADLAEPGAFRVAVPTAAGRVWIGAFADENANGRPDEGDLAGWFAENPVVLDEAPATIAIALRPVGAEPPPE